MDEETKKAAKKAAYRWWQSMMLSPAELQPHHIPPAPTVYKARLRRCATPEAAMLTEGFKALWFSLPVEIFDQQRGDIVDRNMECWATIAAALVNVKTDTKRDIAYEAGKKEEGDKSLVSELRFRKLQNAKTPEEFLWRLRRILHQIKGKVSPEQLIDDISQWFAEHNRFIPRKADKRIAVRWAMSYYRAAAARK